MEFINYNWHVYISGVLENTVANEHQEPTKAPQQDSLEPLLSRFYLSLLYPLFRHETKDPDYGKAPVPASRGVVGSRTHL